MVSLFGQRALVKADALSLFERGLKGVRLQVSPNRCMFILCFWRKRFLCEFSCGLVAKTLISEFVSFSVLKGSHI